jgi:hypothetical protein
MRRTGLGYTPGSYPRERTGTAGKGSIGVISYASAGYTESQFIKFRVVLFLAWCRKMGSTSQSEEGLSGCTLKVSFRRQRSRREVLTNLYRCRVIPVTVSPF